VKGHRIRIGVEAPESCEILRGELHEGLRAPWSESASA
jgi:sRNA-binding carbon storage regulator CsrA